ncbi:Metalloenzyme, LuxS/M16 peptidase-like protein [Dichotomocladium elegans]|nr:Metalloenzyme, LuxS/M16 peptidase-like protein [Dichotomocladium elegans]
MASRLLSHTRQTRTIVAKQLARSMATAASKQAAVATRTTVLPNGFTIATEENPSAGAATVGVWIDAGSRLESAQTHGVASLLERAAVQSKAAALGKLGGITQSATSREQTSFATTVLGSNVSEAVEVLGDLVQNNHFDEASVRQAVGTAQTESNIDQIVFDHLLATAFQGESLGRPVAGYHPESLTPKDLLAYKADNYVANRMVLVGAGDVDHDALVRDAEKAFGGLASGSEEASQERPSFTGSEIRIRDDVLPTAHIALAVEGAGYLTPDYFKLSVMSAIIGTYDRTLGGAANLTSRLSAVVDRNHLANSFVSFNKGFKDTGIWGNYFITENRDQIDDYVHFLQKEWVRLSTSVTPGEVEIAKQQLFAKLLLSNDSTSATAQDIASQVLATGKRFSPAELKEAISKITAKDIHAAGNKYLWDQEVAVVGHGPVECLTDYTRVRGNMAYNRF